MELGPNEFWAVVYDTHDGVMRVISDEDGVPYLYKGKNNAVSHRRTMPAELLKPYVARVRVEVAR